MTTCYKIILHTNAWLGMLLRHFAPKRSYGRLLIFLFYIFVFHEIYCRRFHMGGGVVLSHFSENFGGTNASCPEK